jgi:hypothetical protein
MNKLKKIIGEEIENICKNQENLNKHPKHDQILKSSQHMKS